MSTTYRPGPIKFSDLLNYIKECKKDDYGFHTLPSGYNGVKFHIFSNLMQVNINLIDNADDPQGLSYMNMIFEEDRVKIYPCEKPGMCLYSSKRVKVFPLETAIDGKTAPRWQDGILRGEEIKETFRDLLHPWVNGSLGA